MNMTTASSFTSPKNTLKPEEAKTAPILETRNASASRKKLKKENNNLPPITTQNGAGALKPKSGGEKIVKKVEIKLRDTSQ